MRVEPSSASAAGTTALKIRAPWPAADDQEVDRSVSAGRHVARVAQRGDLRTDRIADLDDAGARACVDAGETTWRSPPRAARQQSVGAAQDRILFVQDARDALARRGEHGAGPKDTPPNPTAAAGDKARSNRPALQRPQRHVRDRRHLRDYAVRQVGLLGCGGASRLAPRSPNASPRRSVTSDTPPAARQQLTRAKRLGREHVSAGTARREHDGARAHSPPPKRRRVSASAMPMPSPSASIDDPP